MFRYSLLAESIFFRSGLMDRKVEWKKSATGIRIIYPMEPYQRSLAKVVFIN